MPVPAKRDLVSIDDLSVDEIMQLFQHADGFRENLHDSSDVCTGQILAALFFEPSTRTRLSFESAMLRLRPQKGLYGQWYQMNFGPADCGSTSDFQQVYLVLLMAISRHSDGCARASALPLKADISPTHWTPDNSASHAPRQQPGQRRLRKLE